MDRPSVGDIRPAIAVAATAACCAAPADCPANVRSGAPVTPEDVEDITGYLAGQTGQIRAAAVQELIWAAVSSSEFRFNH